MMEIIQKGRSHCLYPIQGKNGYIPRPMKFNCPACECVFETDEYMSTMEKRIDAKAIFQLRCPWCGYRFEITSGVISGEEIARKTLRIIEENSEAN